LKIAIIGCGNIAEFHVPALRSVGFEIAYVASSLNSSTVGEFANRHSIDNVFKNPIDLIESHEWDALLIASPIETIIEYIHKAVVHNKPILIEKPVALNYNDLNGVVDYENVYVAYNRRFYKTTKYVEKFLKDHPKSLIKVTIPESDKSADGYNTFPNKLPILTYENSVHVVDLVNYLIGKIEWNSVDHVIKNNKYLAISALGVGEQGFHVVLDICYNSPANFSIDILHASERIEMRPIEIAYHYEGMRVEEPSNEIPIRRYLPLIKETIINSSKAKELKPGFYEQAMDFMKICQGRLSDRSATLRDARDVLEVVHKLSKPK
jgi:predicted dehydrogenase